MNLNEWLKRNGVNRIVVALSFARMADALGNSLLIVVIPLYVVALPSPAFDLPESLLVGILISIYGLIFTLVQPFTGALSDRLGKRKIFIQGGMLLMTISTLSFIVSDRYLHLIFVRALQGIGVAFTVPAALAVLAVTTIKSSRGGSMGFYSAMRMVGFAVGPLLGGVLQVYYGFTASFITGGALLLLAAILVQWLVDEPEVMVDPTAERIKYRVLDSRLLGGGTGFLAVATMFMAIAFSMMASLENEFNLRLDQTAIGFGVAFSALTVSRLIFQFPLGRLSDRIGRKSLIIIGLIAMAPVTALLGMVGSTLQLTLVRAAQGAAAAGIAAPAFALAGDLSTSGGEGQQMGVLAMGFGSGIAIGPLIAGFFAVFDFRLPFLLGGLLCLLGAWIVIRKVPESIHRTPPTSVSEEI